MDKSTYKKCMEREVYAEYRNSKGHLNLFDKIWCKYISPRSNAVYLIRKEQLLNSKKDPLSKIRSKRLEVLLIRRYCIHVNPDAQIGIGLKIVHPQCITIAACNIGENFTVYQNCTIGAKGLHSFGTPTVGDNVIMYCGSSVIGNIKVADEAVIAANALLISDAEKSGLYCGIPAVLKSNQVKNA